MQINDVRSTECPVSLTDGKINELLGNYSECSRFEGCSIYGNNLSEWPADVFDAHAIFLYEETRIENAKMDRDSQKISLS